MITTKKQGNKSLAEVITEILDSGTLKNENFFENIFESFNASWQRGRKLEIFVDTYNSKLLFRKKGDYRPNYRDIDLIGDYIKIGELNLKLLSRNKFFSDCVDLSSYGYIINKKDLSEEKIKEYLDSKLLRRKILSLSDKFLKDKLINKSTYPLLDLYTFKIRKEESTIEQKVFALYKNRIQQESVLSYFDLSKQELELMTVKENIVNELSGSDSREIGANASDFSLWFDKNVLNDTDSTLTSLFEVTINSIKDKNLKNNKDEFYRSNYRYSPELDHLSLSWNKLRGSKRLTNTYLPKHIKKDFLRLLSYNEVKSLRTYSLSTAELFDFFKEDFIFHFDFYNELVDLTLNQPIKDFYIDTFIEKSTSKSKETLELIKISDKIKNLYVSKEIYNKFIDVLTTLGYDKDEFISPNTTVLFLEDLKNIDEIKERFV